MTTEFKQWIETASGYDKLAKKIQTEQLSAKWYMVHRRRTFIVEQRQPKALKGFLLKSTE
jgi:hypothetical protein